MNVVEPAYGPAKSPALTGLFFEIFARIGGKVLSGFFQFRFECEQQRLFVLFNPTTLNQI